MPSEAGCRRGLSAANHFAWCAPGRCGSLSPVSEAEQNLREPRAAGEVQQPEPQFADLDRLIQEGGRDPVDLSTQ